MSADWYARRLAMEQGNPPPPQQYVPQPQYVNPPQYPQVPQHIQQHQPNPGVNPGAMTEAEIIKMAREGLITDASLAAMVASKGGGKGTKTETMDCPECGGHAFFQRKALSKMGNPPAPICMDCGYNGMFEQYGAMDIPVTIEG